MIFPMARQGGANSRTGVHLQEYSGDQCLRSSPMDQNVKESVDNGLQNRRHPVVAWQPGADEGSPSLIESIAVGDLVYTSTDVSLPSFQKLRGGATHLPDLSSFSEDEEALDPTHDGSPISHNRRRKHSGYSSAHLNVFTNINDVTPDELSVHSEDYSFHRVKLLCSYGGKILPRPTDNQLRYVGGDTRLITVSRDIHFHELMQKMADLYALAQTIKYKLPEEDLDALVSVSSNEDVANMMEEYDRLQSSNASPRLRLFLFSDMDHESVHPNESFGDHRSTEQRYVYAVNAISESSSKKFSGDGGSLAIAPVVIDSLIDVGDPWGLIRQQDTVPVAMLAPQISQDVASFIHQVPVALPVSSIPSMSAPSSAPSSPPLIPRVMKQGLIPEMRLSFHSDQHLNTSGHQYNIVQADGAVVEGDSYVINVPTSAIVHEHGYKSSDLQRGMESPRKLKHDGDSLHLEPVARDDVRRLPEVRIPRVLSHGKLTRLSDHHSEASLLVRQRHTYQQPQPSQQHGGWQPNLFEEQTHVFSRRAEIVQSTTDVVAQPVAPGQQLQLPHIRSPFLNVSAAPTIDQPVYRPVDHLSQGDEVFAPFMQRSISVNTMGPLVSTAATSFSVAAGSAPSSPRMNHRDPLNMHASGQAQLQQILRSHAAPNYVEQQHGLRYHARNDLSTRLGPATSPPRYRDHLGQTDERLLRPLQQPVRATTDGLQLELFMYDGHGSAHGQYSEVAKVPLPQYLGHNPFQESPSSFAESSPSETQDGGDGRRYRENASQKSFHPLHYHAREDFQGQVVSSAEPRSVQARYQEKPINWVVHQCGRDVDESIFWRGGRGRTGQNEEVNEGDVADVDATDGCFLHLPEDSENLLMVSDSHRARNSDVGEPLNTNNQQYRSTVTQSHVLSVYPSTQCQASVVDTLQIPPYVGLESEPGFLVEPVPKRVEGTLEFGSTPALIEVSNLQPEILSNKLASLTNMDDKAGIITFENSVSHLSSAACTRVGNTETLNSAELRWGELNDFIESRINMQARDSSNILDQFQQLSGSGVAQGRQSESAVGTRIEASEELALQRLHNNSTILKGDGLLVEEEIGSVAYGFRNPVLNDGMPPIMPQLSVSKGQAQVLQPMTIRGTAFTLPALSITVSTELAIPSMPSACANASTAVGSSIIEQETDRMGSRLFNAGSTPPKISQSDICGVSGPNAENRRKDNKAPTSQISAAGHIDEDITSSVLVSSTREILVPQPSASNMQAEDKGKWLSFTQDATGVVLTTLIHAPTFSAPNWDNLRNLSVTNTEIDDAEMYTPDATAESEDFGLQPPIIVEKLRSIEDLVTEAVVPIHEDLEQGSSSPGCAEDAEAEAIRSGLQTILNADLEEMRELGSGTFGTVYHGKWRGTDVAIKRIKSSCFAGRPAERDRLIADFWREACTLSQLHHPNVVAFYGVVRDGPGGTLATVTEYMVNGSLKQVLQKKDRTIDRRKRLLIAMDAAFGMEYLHSKNIVHFDLKCDNLLVNMRDPQRPICKVGDLGLSKVKHQTMVSGGVRGTLPWMAPELLNGSSTLVTEKVDVFSFGIVMWELLTGEEPYASMHYGAIIGGIVNNTLRPSIPSWCDPLWKSLMEKCWSAEPTCRPSFSEVASELRVMATALQPKAHGPVHAEVR